jgi:23S rRNA G2069 N7-methylase RlmK/C1962 C5-methylase RlmI
MKRLIVFILCFLITDIQAQEPENGFVNKNIAGKLQVWNTDENDWSDIKLFWQGFAKKNKSKSWGNVSVYPNYDEVNEFDTLVIELKQGSCLMQFYHSRWRRANDVQRWNDAFNEFGGCPYVFD